MTSVLLPDIGNDGEVGKGEHLTLIHTNTQQTSDGASSPTLGVHSSPSPGSNLLCYPEEVQVPLS